MDQYVEKYGARPSRYYECVPYWNGCGQMYYPEDTAPEFCICGAKRGIFPYCQVVTYKDSPINFLLVKRPK